MTPINVGSAPDNGTGDPLRTAFQKVNANFAQTVWHPASADITGPIFHVRSFGAIPNDGVCDLVAIQAAIEAASAVGGTVLFDEGVYQLNPDNLVYPGRLSEGMMSCLTIWANNVKLVGAGGHTTTLRLLNSRAGNVKVNMLGSGNATPVGFSNVQLRGFNLDAAGFNAECTQIYSAVNWVVTDVGVKNTPIGCDGFDFQYGSGNSFSNIFAEDIYENAFGTQDTGVVVDGFFVLRCGVAGGFGAAFQINAGPPVMRNVVAVDCPYLLATNSSCHFQNSYFRTNNSTASVNDFSFTAGTLGIFENVMIVTPIVATGAIFSITGGSVELTEVVANNLKPVIAMSSGNLTVRQSVLGATGGQRPLAVTGATTLRLFDSTFNGFTSQRDIRIEGAVAGAVITGNKFMGSVGALFNSGSITNLTCANNYVATGMFVAVGAGCEFRSNHIAGALNHDGGSPRYAANRIVGTYTRVSGTPIFTDGNMFETAANVTEVQESLPAFNAITPTTTTTTYTNNNPFAVMVYFRGGSIESVSKNGTQIYGNSTNGNAVELGFGETVSLANSNISGMVVNWSQKR